MFAQPLILPKDMLKKNPKRVTRKKAAGAKRTTSRRSRKAASARAS